LLNELARGTVTNRIGAAYRILVIGQKLDGPRHRFGRLQLVGASNKSIRLQIERENTPNVASIPKGDWTRRFR